MEAVLRVLFSPILWFCYETENSKTKKKNKITRRTLVHETSLLFILNCNTTLGYTSNTGQIKAYKRQIELSLIPISLKSWSL